MYGKYRLIFQYGELDNTVAFLLSTWLVMIVNTVICVMIYMSGRGGSFVILQLIASSLIQIQGEMGQHKLNEFKKVEDAIKDFEKKFKDKTKNNWSDRENFTPHPGKYTLIEVDGEEDAEVKVNVHFI